MKLESIKNEKFNDFKADKINNLASILGGAWQRTSISGTNTAGDYINYTKTETESGVCNYDYGNVYSLDKKTILINREFGPSKYHCG